MLMRAITGHLLRALSTSVGVARVRMMMRTVFSTPTSRRKKWRWKMSKEMKRRNQAEMKRRKVTAKRVITSLPVNLTDKLEVKMMTR